VALSVLRAPREERLRQIVVITRLADGGHKGSRDLLEIISPTFASCTFIVLADPRKSPQGYVQELRRRADFSNAKLVFQTNVSDMEKFEILFRSKAMLFCSLFEGFGYPPVEAVFTGLPVVCYDLPVIRETCSAYACYVAPGDVNGLRRTLLDVVDTGKDNLLGGLDEFRAHFEVRAFGERLHNILVSTKPAVLSRTRLTKAVLEGCRSSIDERLRFFAAFKQYRAKA